MDKALVLKIIGKKDSVDLGDSIYNLRNIGYKLREVIILNIPINDDLIIKNKESLTDIQGIISNIADKLEADEYIKGYTNSKNYLEKYICDLRDNIDGILLAIEHVDIKLLTNHTNMLMDLVLAY